MAGNRSATEIDIQLGQRLRAIRLSRRMSQQRLADAAGVSFQQVQKYEAGTDRLSVSRLCQFATVLEFAPSAFLDGFAPGVGPRDLFDDQLATTEGADLMRAFRAIRSVKLRRRAVSVVEALGDEA